MFIRTSWIVEASSDALIRSRGVLRISTGVRRLAELTPGIWCSGVDAGKAIGKTCLIELAVDILTVADEVRWVCVLYIRNLDLKTDRELGIAVGVDRLVGLSSGVWTIARTVASDVCWVAILVLG